MFRTKIIPGRKSVTVDNGRAKLMREMFAERRAVRFPGAYDSLSAKMIEAAGFEGLQVSGYGLAGSLYGLPDIDIMPLEKSLEATERIVRAVAIPVMADADTGGGGPLNAAATTERIIRMGCAGMNLEDQNSPKRCGHMQGKEVISMEEMVSKTRAASEKRDELNPDFVLNIRTDAYAIYGEDEVVRRCVAYVQAGADMLFVDGIPAVADLVRVKERVYRELEAVKGSPLIEEEKPFFTYNVMDGIFGARSEVPEDIRILRENGISRVSIPVGTIQVAHRHVLEYLKAMKESESGFLKGQDQWATSFQHYTKFVGLPEFKAREQAFGYKFYDDVENPVVQGPVSRETKR